MRFTKFDEAKAALDALLSETQGGERDDKGKLRIQSCPLLAGGDCRTDCVCWSPARMVTNERWNSTGEEISTYDVFPGRCGNAMFSGHQLSV